MSVSKSIAKSVHTKVSKSDRPKTGPVHRKDPISAKVHLLTVKPRSVDADVKAAPFLMVSVDEKGQPTVAKQAQAGIPRNVGSERDFAKSMLGLRPIRTQLIVERNPVTGTVNTAYNGVISSNLLNSNNWSSWNALFDEVRCLDVQYQFVPWVVASGSGSSPVGGMMTACVDFNDASAFGSHAANMVATKHIGPVPMGMSIGTSATTGQFLSVGLTQFRDGHISIHSGKLPREFYNPSGSGLIGGMWAPANSSQIVVCYFKWYVDALGANLAFAYKMFETYTVEFKFLG